MHTDMFIKFCFGISFLSYEFILQVFIACEKELESNARKCNSGELYSTSPPPGGTHGMRGWWALGLIQKARLKGDSLLTFYKVQSFVSLDCFLQRSVWLLMVFKIHIDFRGQTIRIVT